MDEGILSGLRVIEGSAFVAAPLGGMTLAQLGADVIRVDQPQGGLDYHRWPLAATGDSLFWAGLNKAKRSVRLNLRSDEGRELLAELIAGAGNFITNLPARGPVRYEALRERREDVVMIELVGNPDGSSEVDYTVNPATGFPWATGPRNLAEPLNSIVPTWDFVLGKLTVIGLLAADRWRMQNGEGQHVKIALSDVAFAMVGNLGRIAEAQLDGTDHPKDGNYLYGAFGHDFQTADHRHVMVVALTTNQWRALVEVTQTADALASVQQAMAFDLASESGRYQGRDFITAVLRPWFETRTLAEIREAFTGTRVSWAPYQTFRQLVDEDVRCSTRNPMFDMVEQPGIGEYLMPGSPLEFSRHGRLPAERAPRLGEHTEEVLAEVLGLTDAEIGALLESGVAVGAA